MAASSWMRSRCGSYQSRTRSISAGQPAPPPRRLAAQRGEARPVRRRARRRREGGERRAASRRRSASRSSTSAAVDGPMPGRSCSTRKPGDAVARVLGEAQQRQHVLDVRGVEEFQPAELDEGNVAPRQLDLERPE